MPSGEHLKIFHLANVDTRSSPNISRTVCNKHQTVLNSVGAGTFKIINTICACRRLPPGPTPCPWESLGCIRSQFTEGNREEAERQERRNIYAYPLKRCPSSVALGWA